MNIYKWVLVGLYVFSALYTVTTIGKPRKVLTPGGAAVSLVFTSGLVWLVILA